MIVSFVAVGLTWLTGGFKPETQVRVDGVERRFQELQQTIERQYAEQREHFTLLDKEYYDLATGLATVQGEIRVRQPQR